MRFGAYDGRFMLGSRFGPNDQKYSRNHFLNAQTKALSGYGKFGQKYFLATKVRPDSGDKNVARNNLLGTFLSLKGVSGDQKLV